MKLLKQVMSIVLLSGTCLGAPTPQPNYLASPRSIEARDKVAQIMKRAELSDGDDQVVYTWSKPDKLKRETADGDDQVVYTWSRPDKTKRETTDGDDQVVYTWSRPEKKA